MTRYLLFLSALLLTTVVSGQHLFEQNIRMPSRFVKDEIVIPPSPLWVQVLFIGGKDIVQTTPTYGNPAGQALAKENHDFIGFTPDRSGASLGWISVNHESRHRDPRIGDGGGMTVFRVKRKLDGSLEIMDQELEDGRKGRFFNVDFVNTVGETGMNCGGIVSVVDGRIWTAEEWMLINNRDLMAGGGIPTSFFEPLGINKNLSPEEIREVLAHSGVRDTADFTIQTDVEGWNGKTIRKYQNFNYMVEIDPRQAKAIRKQYNWGRQGFEGGCVMPDNRTVYLGVDATPAFWSKFVADKPGDFTKGRLYVYKQDAEDPWIELDNQNIPAMLNFTTTAIAAGATMFNRVEWVTVDTTTGLVYATETGRDKPGSAWKAAYSAGAGFAQHHIERAKKQAAQMKPKANWGPESDAYTDYYGRVLVFDPKTNEMEVHLAGGPELEESPKWRSYPDIHLSNPDGLNIMMIDGQQFLTICEDLNGTSHGRVPAGVENRTCELFLLDLSIENPQVDDLIRITAVPKGAEVTGAMPTPDGQTLLVDVQHPDPTNPEPYNHSLTLAIHGFGQLQLPRIDPEKEPAEAYRTVNWQVNSFNRELKLGDTMDAALYNADGKRIKVWRSVSRINCANLEAGTYYLKTEDDKNYKLVIQ